MVKQLPDSLPDYLPDYVPHEQISSIMVDNSEPANRVKFYHKYDEDLVIVGNYMGHMKCVEAFRWGCTERSPSWTWPQ
jgi:hypothetical protein